MAMAHPALSCLQYFVLKMFTQILLGTYKETTAKALKARQALGTPSLRS